MTDKIAWHTSFSDWSVDGYVWKFWFLSQAWLVKRHGERAERTVGIDYTDLQELAVGTLLDFAPGWPDICERQGLDPANVRIFWHMLKLELGWAAGRYFARPEFDEKNVRKPLTQVLEGGDETESPDLIRTILMLRTGADSMLQQQIVDVIGRLSSEEQMLLALRFHEELSKAEIGHVLSPDAKGDGSAGLMMKRMRVAAERVLLVASTLTGDTRVEIPPAPASSAKYLANAETWTWANYQCDVDTYLEWVRVCYRADVRALVDILIIGRGGVIRVDAPATSNARAPLSMHTIAEIRRRLAEGESQMSISRDLGVGQPTISNIKRGRAYRRVA